MEITLKKCKKYISIKLLFREKIIYNIDKILYIKMTVGKHIILDLHGVDSNILQSITLENFDMFNNFIEYVLSTSNITLLSKNVHFFDLIIENKKMNGAFTALYLLSESHLSIHTWPERNFIAIDIFTCGECDIHSVAERISYYFEAKQKNITVLSRGKL